LSALRQFIITEWKLQPANIVIPVLSGVTNHKPFKSQKMIDTLRNGIKNVRSLLCFSSITHAFVCCIQAANASEVWFITNGIDAGVPQLIGAAFREEIVC
jgi:hypothetical protein